MLRIAAALMAASIVLSGDGVPIAYADRGKGEPALVFVHCWSCDRHLWDAQVPAFAGDHRVVALDLAGHGESGKGRTDWTIAAFGGDVIAVVEKLGAKRVVLVGSSMGGPVTLEAARTLKDRVAGLVPVDILHDVGQKAPPEQIEPLIRAFQADYRREAAKYLNRLFAPATPAAVRKRVLAEAAAAPPEIAIASFRGAMEYDPVPALREIRAPIHAINSDLFPTNLDGNRKYARRFEAVVMTGVGHYPMLEDPARFNRLLAEALRELSRWRPAGS